DANRKSWRRRWRDDINRFRRRQRAPVGRGGTVEVRMTGGQSHVTRALAQFVAGSEWGTIPPEVRREGMRGLLNFAGCALGGARDEAMDIAIKVLAPFFGPPQVSVIGRSERPDALNAAFL